MAQTFGTSVRVEFILEVESVLISSPALFIKPWCRTDIQYLSTQNEILLQFRVLLLQSSDTAEHHTLPASVMHWMFPFMVPVSFIHGSWMPLCSSFVNHVCSLLGVCVLPPWFLYAPFMVPVCSMVPVRFFHKFSRFLCAFFMVPVCLLHASCLLPLWFLIGPFMIFVLFLYDSRLLPSWFLHGSCVRPLWFLCDPAMRLLHGFYIVPVWFRVPWFLYAVDAWFWITQRLKFSLSKTNYSDI